MWAALQVEAALAADDRERDSRASEVLKDVDWDVFSERRYDQLKGWLADAKKAVQRNDRGELLQLALWATSSIEEMYKQQLAVNDFLSLVQKILDGHDVCEDLGPLQSKLKEAQCETDD
jgi:hypothetical protein